MLRFDLKLLPLEDGASEAEAQLVADSNAAAKHSCKHLKKLIGHKKCRKHPSSPNKIRITAIKGGDPKAEMLMYCCPEFIKMIK